MSTRRVDYLHHPDCQLHAMGPDQPELPARVDAVADGLRSAGLYPALTPREAQPASPAQLARAHEASYLEMLQRRAPTDDATLVRLDWDTLMNRHSLRAAALAAGAGVQAVDRVLVGEADAAFCNLRPPGHHAERERAMGFCFYNSVAIAALHALEEHGLSRVAIVDFDVHYGNGTADIVAGDERILLCSLYQYPLYPLDAGPPEQLENFSDIRLDPGAGGREFRTAVSSIWGPALTRLAPELLLFSAGFDAHTDDPLAQLEFVEDDYSWVTRELLAITQDSANGRAVSILEGGYDLAALGRSAAAHVRELLAA